MTGQKDCFILDLDMIMTDNFFNINNVKLSDQTLDNQIKLNKKALEILKRNEGAWLKEFFEFFDYDKCYETKDLETLIKIVDRIFGSTIPVVIVTKITGDNALEKLLFSHRVLSKYIKSTREVKFIAVEDGDGNKVEKFQRECPHYYPVGIADDYPKNVDKFVKVNDDILIFVPKRLLWYEDFLDESRFNQMNITFY